MSQMLATDLNNPDFQGAVNPDSQLYVEFYMHKAIDKWRSDEQSVEQGRRVTIYRKRFTLDKAGNATYKRVRRLPRSRNAKRRRQSNPAMRRWLLCVSRLRI